MNESDKDIPEQRPVIMHGRPGSAKVLLNSSCEMSAWIREMSTCVHHRNEEREREGGVQCHPFSSAAAFLSLHFPVSARYSQSSPCPVVLEKERRLPLVVEHSRDIRRDS